MPRKYKKVKPEDKNLKDNLEKAIKAVKEDKVSVRAAAKLHGVSRTSLQRRLNPVEKLTKSVGGQLSIPKDAEIELAQCLKLKSKWGFGNTIKELRQFVKMYVDQNITKETEIGKYLRKYCKFTNNMPGEDWCTAFLRRYRLSSKLPSTLEKSRKSAATDPEIIYGYFDILDTEMQGLQLHGRPECIWNIDETCLFIDPSKTRVIAPVGEKASRVTSTSGREATTIMAGISASGEKLPPFILFKGKKFWTSWKGTKPYPGTQYAFSDSGWMVADVFAAWFDFFANHIPQRPLLLVYDGHSTHLTSAVINKARAENITIIKLPPHTTDLLQPLDVCCFKPLKTRWDATIAKWQAANYARRITKGEFVDLVGRVWDECFSVEIIQTAFRKTGLYPPDRDIYPVAMFNPDLYKLYKSVQTPEPVHKPATPRKDIPPRENISPSTSFEQIMADVFRKPFPSTSGTAQRTARRQIDVHSRVITHDEFLEAVEDKEKKALEKKKKAEERSKKKGTKKRKATAPSDDEDDDNVDDPLPSLEDIVEEEPSAKKGKKVPEKRELRKRFTSSTPLKVPTSSEEEEEEEEALNPLNSSHSSISSIEEQDKEDDTDEDEEEDEDEEKESGVARFDPQKYLYIQKKKSISENGYYGVDYGKAYIGRVTKSDKTSLRMTFLQRKPDDMYDWPKKADVDDNIDLKYVFCGPLKLVGTTPYQVRGVDDAYKQYIKFRKVL